MDNLKETAYRNIKQRILSCELMPGTRIKDKELIEEIGVGRTPVREALRALSSEGFVDVRNGIGAYVKPLSSKDMEDLYEVRCLLELQAVRTSIYRITDEEIDALEARFQALYDACERGEHPGQGEFSELDWALHSLLVERCTNNYIKEIIAGNNSNLRRYQALSVDALGDVRESARQHLEILRILRTRDLAALSEALHAHLLWSAGLLHTGG